MASLGNNLKPNIEWSLSDEGMGELERVGLAGLYLSLTAADKWAEKGDIQAHELKKILKWQLEDKSVKLNWNQENSDSDVLTKLIEWSWQIRDGVYFLPGIHRGKDSRENSFLRVPTHSGLNGTFLQFTGRLKPKLEDNSPSLFQFDSDNPSQTMTIYYRKIRKGEQVRQKNALKNLKICPLRNRKDEFRIISLPGWLSPGSAQRFGKAERAWTGTTDKALLLLFTPIACFFMKLPKTKAKKKMRENWAFLAPEIRSFSTITRNYKDMQAKLQGRLDRVAVSSLGDAGLRFAAGYAGKITQRKFSAPTLSICAMGVTDYYSSNPRIVTKIRKNIIRMRPDWITIRRYQKLMRIIPNFIVQRRDNPKFDEQRGDRSTHYVRQPTSRGRIADNLVNDLPWYQDLLLPPQWQRDELEVQIERLKQEGKNISKKHLWFKNLQKERWSLMDLSKEKAMWDTPQEQLLVSVFHINLRKLLNIEEKALSRGGSRPLYERWEDRADKIRRGLMHAKTLPLARKFLMEFLAEGGGSKKLTENRQELWNLVNHPHDWKKARDLALLALVTFTDKRLANEKQQKGENNE